MKRSLVTLATLTLIVCAARLNAGEPQLAHMVFFTLANDNQENRDTLVAACQKYLTGHDGTVYFSAGSRAPGLGQRSARPASLMKPEPAGQRESTVMYALPH